MKEKKAKTVIVLGSGGHTAEMMEVIKHLDKTKYSPRYYIVAKSDITSRNRIKSLEESNSNKSYTFYEINRSREVKQSFITTIFTTLIAILSSFPLIYNLQPHLILCNGPGTCVPICLVAVFFRKLRMIPKSCKIVFLESYCRVKTISLSGKILKYFVDLFVVQWPQLETNNAKYLGRLM